MENKNCLLNLDWQIQQLDCFWLKYEANCSVTERGNCKIIVDFK